jgi:hypothetical protein
MKILSFALILAIIDNFYFRERRIDFYKFYFFCTTLFTIIALDYYIVTFHNSYFLQTTVKYDIISLD